MSEFDITKYPEALDEIIKHMDYMPDASEEEKKQLLLDYLYRVIYC